MGTRCLTVFKKDNKEICVLYRQYDGYPEVHGEELKTFLSGKRIINGFCGETLETAFNGMDCLTAAVIAHFKTEIGGFYVYPPGTRDVGEDYIYTIEDVAGIPKITVNDVFESY